jgi:hypothetical protein
MVHGTVDASARRRTMIHGFRLLNGMLVTALLGLLFSACGSVGPALEPAQVAHVRGTLARSYIPERQIKIMWVRSNGGGGGLMGAVISGSLNRGRKNAAEEMVRPLQAQSQDVNYQWMFWNALEPILKEVPWLRSVGLQGKPSAVEEPSSEDLARYSVLKMGSDFELSVDSSTLLVQTGFSFFEQGGSGSPAAATIVYYRSEKVGQLEDEKAVGLWAANRAARLRMALAEGVAENMKLIRLALFCMGRMNCPTGGPHHLRFRLNEGRDFGSLVGEVEADGTIIEEGPYRVVFRGVNGALYSIPRSAIESQSGHGPPPQPPVMAPPPPASPPAASPSGQGPPASSPAPPTAPPATANP